MQQPSAGADHDGTAGRRGPAPVLGPKPLPAKGGEKRSPDLHLTT